MHISNVIGRAATPVAIAIIFALSRRYLPASARKSVTNSDERYFARIQWLVGAAMISVGAIFGLVVYKALVWSNSLLVSNNSKALYVLLPDRWIWFFLPFFGALCLAWELTLRLWCLFGNSSQARKYENWSNAKAGFDATRVLRLMAIGIGIPIAILTVMALPMHTSITETGISIHHFGKLNPTVYSYSDVRKITVTEGLRTRDGSLQKRPAIVLDFSDGTKWSSADNRPIDKAVDPGLLNLLQSKTGLTARYIDAFPFGAI